MGPGQYSGHPVYDLCNIRARASTTFGGGTFVRPLDTVAAACRVKAPGGVTSAKVSYLKTSVVYAIYVTR
jgi:hypothetical protein